MTFLHTIVSDFKRDGYPTVTKTKHSVNVVFITETQQIVQYVWTKLHKHAIVKRIVDGKLTHTFRRFRPTKEQFLAMVRDADDEAWAELAAEEYIVSTDEQLSASANLIDQHFRIFLQQDILDGGLG